jgi:two-component system CheB/CheR fusion protein
VLRSGEGTHVEETVRRADDSTFLAECWSYPIKRDRRTIGVVLTFLDITNRKRAEEEIRTGARRRDEFLAMLSHELRNPLSAVFNASTVLRAGAPQPKFNRALEILERQSRHMTRLLDDLLDVSRITRGGIEIRKEDTDLRQVIDSAIEALSPVLQDRSIHVAIDIAPEMLAVRGDPDRLQQVIVNILTNAVRYSPSGRPVRLSAQVDDDMVVVRVKDEGRGIPQNMLSEIFELFVQASQGLDRSGGGLGIGLTLVRKIVELHGGSITAHSDGPGTGSEFVIRLPYLQNAVIYESPGAPIPVKLRRVVVVEDQDDSREMLQVLLQEAGHKVFAAGDGIAAVGAIEREHPDVALVDIGLPGMNGYEIARKVRENPVLDDVILIAVTSYGMDSDIKAAKEAGFDEHLRKPVDLKAIQEILSTRTVRKKAS